MNELEQLQEKYLTTLTALMDMWPVVDAARGIVHARSHAQRQHAIAETVSAVRTYDLMPDILALEAALEGEAQTA